MVTIVDAYPASGYSSCDHLLTGREADGVVGREFRSIRLACEAADREVSRFADRRAISGGPHVVVTIQMADGRIVKKRT